MTVQSRIEIKNKENKGVIISRRILYVYVGLFSIVLAFTGCKVLPSMLIEQPWSRVIESDVAIPLGAKLNVTVSGQTSPLLGNESLTQERIRSISKELLQRRGFAVDERDYSYSMKILYKSDQISKNTSISRSSTISNYKSIESSSYSRYGLGVMLASSIREASATSLSSLTNINYDVISYIHTYAIEIYDKNDNLLWQAETYWDSPDLNIINQSISRLQILFSNLPYNYANPVVVKNLNESRFKSFYDLYVKNKMFNCPALPYMIYFEHPSQRNDRINYSIKDKDARATMAFLDLLQTAEFCLPSTRKSRWDNPVDPYIWTNIILGGQYVLESTNENINVLIDLVAEKTGYLVKNCRVVSDKEYEEYQRNIEQWKNTLADHFDFFVH